MKIFFEWVFVHMFKAVFWLEIVNLLAVVSNSIMDSDNNLDEHSYRTNMDYRRQDMLTIHYNAKCIQRH